MSATFPAPSLAEIERRRIALHPMPSDTSAFIDMLIARVRELEAQKAALITRLAEPREPA